MKNKSQEAEKEKIGSDKAASLKNPQVIYSWKAPARAYKKRSRGVLRFYIALALLLSLIVYLFGERILVLPIWAAIFLFYVLTITPPPTINNRITKFGIATGKNTFRWEALSHFYYYKKFDYYVIVVVNALALSTHIYLVVKDKAGLSKIINILSEHLVFQDTPQKTFTDKAAEYLTKLMPEETVGKTERKEPVNQEEPEQEDTPPADSKKIEEIRQKLKAL